MAIQGVRAIVTDIEGTTSSISFVHDILFPYARARIADYVREHAAQITPILNDIRDVAEKPDLDIDGCIQILLDWMVADKKIAPLKTLQGQIWLDGYKSGAFSGHVYDDAVRGLRAWAGAGIKLYVYSSGSVAAQKQIFGYSVAGDLTPLFSGYFDTLTGAKKEPASYTSIVQQIGLKPSAVLFLSDNPDELRAAREAGLCIMGLDRPGNTFDLTAYPTVTTFDDIELEIKHDSAA